VALTLEECQDENFPLAALLESVFAGRLARAVGKALISGSGNATPTGLLTAAIASGASPIVANGSSANTGGTETGSTSVGTADIGRLYAALDPAYRPGAAFYMNDSTLQYLAQLTDKSGRPVVSFSETFTDLSASRPFIMGRPCAICPSMPSMASGYNSVAFANPKYIIQRRVPSSMFCRRYTRAVGLVTFGLIGFEMWMRVDSNLVAPNPSYLPAQVLQNHS